MNIRQIVEWNMILLYLYFIDFFVYVCVTTIAEYDLGC